MNKLTINRVALGSLRRRRSQYRAMIIGAGLAIFFVSALFLSVQSIYETYRQAHINRVGSQDAILRDAEAVTPEALLESGLVAEVGSVYVLGEIEDGACPIGYYDEAGARMAGPALIEGRMPERVGEIAVEPNFLEKLRSKAKVGDAVELTLKVPRGVRGEFLPDPVKKTYRIVGILKPQSIYLAGTLYSEYEYLKYPGAIVSAEELIEPGGRAVVHRMVRLRPGVRFNTFDGYAEQQLDMRNTLATAFALFKADVYSRDFNGPGQTMIIIAGIIGTVLVLSACLGIVNAFSSNLSERRTQIGMMRAVGATSRQIRQIFGREALLLALCIAPAAIALSYLFVWGLTKWIGSVSFYANPWFLPIDFIASMLWVALAAWIPLTGASRLPPMQAIREVSLLRARRRVKVRPRQLYDAPRLIAGRHLSLYRTRQAGIAAMMVVSILLIAMALPFVANLSYGPAVYDYQIVGYRWGMDTFVETNVSANEGLNDGDVAEVLALPLVSGVEVAAEAQINLLMDQVTPYATTMYGSGYWAETPPDQLEGSARDDYQKFRAAQGLTREALPSTLYACGEDFVAAFSPYVLEGKIEIAALNAGREVLVIAPEAYYRYEVRDEYGNMYSQTSFKPIKDKSDVQCYTNDTYHAGDMLSILRLYTRGALSYTKDGMADYTTGIEREEASVTIGAILSEDVFNVLNDLELWNRRTPGIVLTTHAGLAAMGIGTAGYISLGAQLSGEPDDAIHAYLTNSLKAIAMRGTGLELVDNLQNARDEVLWQAVLKVCLLALVLLMMSMCVSLVNNAITNRVRSDKRSIGTLRAVGAQLHDIVRSYQLQALAMIGWGVLAGTLLSGGFYLWNYLANYVPYDRPFDVPFGSVALAESAFLLAIALLCGLNLTMRIREITRDSIVSNIREL